MEKEDTKSAANKIAGSGKDTTGEFIADKELQAKGKAQKAKGHAQDAVGDIKDAVK